MGYLLRYFVLFFGLVGCGGGADDGAGAPAPGSSGGGGGPGSLACAMTGCEIARLPITAAMPTGTAVYAGSASVAQMEGAFVRTTNADLHLEADFGTRAIALELRSFDNGTTDFTGTATGSAAISGASFSGSFSGDLSSGAGTQSVSGTLVGQFRGEQAIALDGEITASGAVSGNGRFFANKQ